MVLGAMGLIKALFQGNYLQATATLGAGMPALPAQQALSKGDRLGSFKGLPFSGHWGEEGS